jgi:hypothetical protein
MIKPAKRLAASRGTQRAKAARRNTPTVSRPNRRVRGSRKGRVSREHANPIATPAAKTVEKIAFAFADAMMSRLSCRIPTLGHEPQGLHPPDLSADLPRWPNWPDPLDFKEVPIAEAVARVNAAGYFVLTHSGHIYKINSDRGITPQTSGGFNNVFASRYARDDDDNLLPAAIAWRRSSERREYHQIGYWPDDYNRPPGSYNLWRGWGVEPQQGNWSIIHDHILDVVANGNHDRANYIIDWCAHMVQRSWEKPGVALVLKGRKGTGKTLLTSILARVVGPKNALITDNGKRLFADFNSHLADKVLIGAEEAFFAGQRELNDRLKYLLTGADIEIEHKFGRRISMKSMHRMIMTSNHADAVEMTDDERRFFVCDVSDKRVGDAAYFAPLWRAANGQDDTTLRAFMYELKTRDITKWNPEEGARGAALHSAREKLARLLKLRVKGPV